MYVNKNISIYDFTVRYGTVSYGKRYVTVPYINMYSTTH